MQKLIFLANGFFIILLLLGYFSPYVSAEYGLYLPTISLLFPLILFANIFFVIYWLMQKPRYAFASAIILMLGWKVIPRHLNWSGSSKMVNCEENDIQLLSQNLQAARYFMKNKRELDKSKLNEFTEWKKSVGDIDIFCFQEQRYHANELLRKQLSDLNEHSADTIGTSIFTRFPIKDKGFIRVGGNTKYAAWADVETEKATVRVYSIHLSSNMISGKAKNVAKDHNLRDTKTWDRIKGMIRSYGRHSIDRNSQLQRLHDHMDQSPYPVIVAGDMNDVPQSFVYRKMLKRFTDSFLERGKGTGATFSGLIPGLRIDYIFSDKNLKVLSHDVLKQGFSDHYPIKASYCLP